MTMDTFWQLIDDARAEAGQVGQEAMLKCLESKIANLPAREIVDWFNFHHLYLDLADRKDLERAATDCGIYLSDDSFLYFRGWLLSQGKDVFYSVLNNPETLSKHVESPSDVRFESFVYAGREAYTAKAFFEEYGLEGMRKWKENWLSENPGKSEFALDLALADKYSIWDASKQRPLSESLVEEIRNGLFARSANREIEVVQTNESLKDVEKILLNMLPSDSIEYRELSIGIYSGYVWGFGMLSAASESFHQEMKDLFTSAGWEQHEPKFVSACPEYTKGKSRLYCHPTEISGPCEASLVKEVCELVARATTCSVTKAEDRGRVFDITPDQYTAALTALHSEIEKDLLKEFSLPDKDSDRLESVMRKHQIMTLKHHTDSLFSSQPYWKYTEQVFNELIDKKKIIERPDAAASSSWNHITAPKFQIKDKPSLDAQLNAASIRAAGSPRLRGVSTKEPELSE